jgi:STIP1 family protein 1
MAAAADGVARQAELRRAEGNACFRKARLGAAIDCYTEASTPCSPKPPLSPSRLRPVLPIWFQSNQRIHRSSASQAIALCPDVAVYWMNRGLCHFRRK